MMKPTAAAAAFCVGCIASFALPNVGDVALRWVMLGVALLSVIWTFGRDKRGVGFAFAVFLCLCGAQYGIWRTQAALANHVPHYEKPMAQSLTVTITDIPETDPETGSTRFIGMAQTENGQRYRILFRDYQQNTSYQVGETWEFSAKLRPLIGMHNPVGFDREAWALANQLDGSASVSKNKFRSPNQKNFIFINDLCAQISQNWLKYAANYPNGNALMRALAIGDTSGLSPSVWAALRPLGLNHLISISGLHIGMVGTLAMWLLHQLLRLSPQIPKRPRILTFTFGVMVAAFYTALAGFNTPALRSLLMFSAFALAWIGRGTLGSWQTWWGAMAIVLLYQPTTVLSVGFWLSFGLVAALIAANGLRLHIKRSALHQAIRAQLSITLVSSIATVFAFGSLPIFAPLANAVAIPVFSFVFVPLALLGSLLPLPDLLIWTAWLGEHCVSFLMFASEMLPEITFAHAPTPLFAFALLGAFLLLLPNGSRLKPLALTAIVAFLAYQPIRPNADTLRVQIIDVGQGLAVLMQTATQNILFDTGTPAAEFALMPHLRAQGIKRLDTLILSHHDNDHDGGFDAVKKHIHINQLYAGQPEFYDNAQHCTAGKHWQIDGHFFEWLTPTPHASNDNDKSCVLRVISGEHALIITGDLGSKGEAKLIEQYGEKLHSHVFILGHHGSKHSNSSAFINTVAPDMAIASSGFGNAFLHPHPDVQQRLSAHGVKLWRTDTQGALQITFTPTSLTIAPMNTYKTWWHKKPFLMEK